MIDLQPDRPLKDAVDRLGNKTPLGSMMNSAEWGALPPELRDRAFFSARVLNEQLLAEMQRRINQGIQQLRDGSDRFMDRGRFVVEMQQILRDMGYQPDPAKRGGLQDLSSSVRLSLIWNMNLEMAQNYAAWKAQQNDVSLRRAPAQELIRVAERIEKRNWLKIWADAGGKLYGGRMIALKTDDIWRRISEFGVPWAPFRYGSGMGTKSIRRREAHTLATADGERLLQEDAAPQVPLQLPFNTGLQGSLKGVPNAGRERLRGEFGYTIQIDGDTISFKRDHTEANEHREETIREELRARARSAFERGEEALGELRREGNAADALFGSPVADEVRRTFLAQIAAVDNGRKQLFHEQLTEEAAAPIIAMIRRTMPDTRAEWKDGHLLVWRPDLLPADLDELVTLSGENPVARNGRLLGYGLESPAPDHDFASVFLLDDKGEVVGGFHAPRLTAAVYAQQRLRDLTDALGGEGAAYSYRIVQRTGGAL
jgi:hypothetical protein